MDKNLPRVYASPIQKTLNNNREIFVTSKTNERKGVENIPKKINEIFSSPHHVYKSKVKIELDGQEIVVVIVGRVGNFLLTLNGDRIPIQNIYKIEKI